MLYFKDISLSWLFQRKSSGDSWNLLINFLKMTFYGKVVLSFNKTKPVAETSETISEKHIAVYFRLFSKKYFLFLIVIILSDKSKITAICMCSLLKEEAIWSSK